MNGNGHQTGFQQEWKSTLRVDDHGGEFRL
jgi:hypothetical protein